MVQEHRLLHERHHLPGVRHLHVRVLPCPCPQRVLQQAREPLSLAPGELQGGVLSAVAVPQPAVVVAAEGAAVVLELDEMQPSTAEDEEIDLMPPSLAVPELEVRPCAVWIR